MKRVFLGWLVALSALYAGDFGREIALPILEAGEERAYVPAADLKAGQSGVITRWLDDNHETIIAQTIVSRIENGRAEIVFKVFDALANDALPTPKLLPRKNDEAVLRKFYDRGMIVSPNHELYQKIEKSYSKTQWIHPDLMASSIMVNGVAAPKRQDFRAFCAAYNVGVLYIVNNNQGQVVDCQSFEVLQSDYLTGRVAETEAVLPFFSRLGTLEGTWIENLTTTQVSAYYPYYAQLLSADRSEEKDSSFFQRVLDLIEQPLKLVR